MIIRFDGETFQRLKLSSYSHHGGELAEYRGRALITGCHWLYSDNCEEGTKTEILDMQKMKWSSGPDYPFATNLEKSLNVTNGPSSRYPKGSFIFYYSTVTIDDSAFIIGGIGNGNLIAEFRNCQWHKYGYLKTNKYAQQNIKYGQQTLIIGGYSVGEFHGTPVKTNIEVWTFPDQNTTDFFIEELQFSHIDSENIALFAVDFDFCYKNFV